MERSIGWTIVNWLPTEGKDCVERDELISKMMSRVERCRRLAQSTTDGQTATVLDQMADEGEADIARLLAEDDRSAAGGTGKDAGDL